MKRRIYLKAGTIKRIHVDKQVIARNLKHGENEPPIKVQTSKGSMPCFEVQIFGPSRVVYSPKKPLSCGARLWIETRAETRQEFYPEGTRLKFGEVDPKIEGETTCMVCKACPADRCIC